MKLFYQLDEEEQNNALQHCADMVIDDLLDGGIDIDPTTDEDARFKERLDAAVEHIKEISEVQEKVDYLMNDPDISAAVYDIALEMAKGAFYHEEGELVIYPDGLVDSEEVDHTDDCPNHPKNKKPSTSLN